MRSQTTRPVIAYGYLLMQIKGVMFKFDGQKEIFHAHTEARSRLELFKQKEGESTNSFLEQFQAIVEAYEHYQTQRNLAEILDSYVFWLKIE